MRVKRFEPSDASRWNLFIQTANNSTFLFHRDFMDYHADRFKDHSLLVFGEKDELISVVPANITDKSELISHQGLSYGGIVVRQNEKLIDVLAIVHAVLKYLHEAAVSTFSIKCIPSFYTSNPSEELSYILFLLNAELYRRDTAMVVDQQNRILPTGNIRREGNKAEKAGAVIREESQCDNFWNQILEPNLKERFGVGPVHSLKEINLLKSRFPEYIKQYSVFLHDKIVAGATLFVTPLVAHCQYISANEEGRRSGSLNFLFRELIETELVDCRYFDFGIVNTNEGKEINKGMLFWKESFGGRTRTHDFYKIQTASFGILENYLINA